MLLSGGVASPLDEVSEVQYSDEEMRAAVQEADNHNRYVTVHAYHPRAVNRALRAGVRCVEHGNLIDDETISLLLEHDAYLAPTLVTFEQLHRFGKQAGLPEASYRKLADVREAGLAALDKAHRAAVNVVYGTDLLGPMHNAQLEEFTLRTQVQQPIDVIRSATTTAAKLLNLDGQIGTLTPGAQPTCSPSTATPSTTPPHSPIPNNTFATSSKAANPSRSPPPNQAVASRIKDGSATMPASLDLRVVPPFGLCSCLTSSSTVVSLVAWRHGRALESGQAIRCGWRARP
jgi:Amidohydrolase family